MKVATKTNFNTTRLSWLGTDNRGILSGSLLRIKLNYVVVVAEPA
jgi:hypothetical protein